jgi:tetratricopeptide (TPR) repeat protein
MLRAVVDEFVRTHGEDVTYFPAYEVVRCLTDEPWKSDARHVTRDTVASIMSLFEEWFVKESVTLSPLEKYEAAEAAYLGRDFSKAAVLFEELISIVDASSDHEAELTERRWALHERLAMTYYSVQRFGEAYEQLKRAIDLKPTDSERWDEVLGNICAMALNQGDYANVPPLLQRLLSNPTAPLSVFFHWLKLLETHRGEAIARTFLSDGLSLAPRVAQHPSFPDYADKYGLAKAS